MKKALILALFLGSCSPMIPQTKLEQEQARLKEERKFNRRNTTKNEIRVVHISLFIGFSLMMWYESSHGD